MSPPWQVWKPAAYPRRYFLSLSESVLPVAERRRDLNLARGQNSRVVQEVLGYSTIGPTMGIYARVTPTIHAAAAKKMQALSPTCKELRPGCCQEALEEPRDA